MENLTKKILFIFLFVLMIPLWRVVLAPTFLELPADFSYEADLLSIDNFYDEERNRYTGEQVSQTNFSYSVLEQREDVLLIENIFDVFTFSGEKIISLRNVLGVDKSTGGHLYGYGDKNRSGYLFAPKFLEPETNFEYWHVNYDVPAKLKYVGEEKIDGLSLYKYETYYENFVIDQTESLTHLEGVPDERGIVVEPYLQIWFEPVTGMMVKYKDETIAYFYDIDTKEKLNPWNKFRNEFTESSVEAKVSEIKILKLKYQIVEYLIPWVLVVLAVLVCLSIVKDYFWSRDIDFVEMKNNRLVLGVFIMSVSLILGGLVYQYSVLDIDDKDYFKVAIPRIRESESSNLGITAFKDRMARNGFIEGENIIYEEYVETDEMKFRELVRYLVRSGDIDLFYSLTTNVSQTIKNETSDIPIVFNLVTHPLEVGLIDSYDNSGNNLVGVRYYAPVASIWYEVDRIMEDNNVSFDRVVVLRGDAADNSKAQSDEAQSFFAKRDQSFVEYVVNDAEDIDIGLDEYLEEADIMFVTCDGSLLELGENIISVANRNGVPVVSCLRSMVDEGALLSFEVDVVETSSIAGDKAALILLGAKPNWMETELPRTRQININSDVADLFEYTIPVDVLRSSNIVNFGN